MMRRMTLRVLVVITPFWPPSPSCPPALQAPPAALGPAVFPTNGRVPLCSLFPTLLLQSPPAHHLWEHFLVFLAVASLPPWCSASHPCSVAHTTKRGWCLFFSGSGHKRPPLSQSTFSLLFRVFSWPLALADASPALPPPCSSSLPVRLAHCHALLGLSNLYS